MFILGKILLKKEKIISIVDNIVENKILARNIAEEKLNITEISKEYLEFINKIRQSKSN